jgi:hypothetical protein
MMQDMIPARSMQKGDIVRAETSAGIARAKGWVTRVIQGEVLATTPKAVLIRGTADVYEDQGCLICGRTLQKFTSRAVYIGPVCAEKNGLFYPTDEELTDEQRQEIRDRIRSTWSGEEWMPRQYTRFTVIEEARATAPPSQFTPEPSPAGPQYMDDSGEKSGNSPQAGLAVKQFVRTHQIGQETAPTPPEIIDVRFSIEDVTTEKHNGRYIVCRARFEHKDRCKSVLGRSWEPAVAPFPPAFPRPGAWLYPVSVWTAHALRDAFPNLNRRGTPAFTALLAQSATLDEARKVKEMDGADLGAIPLTKTTPWEHQTRAFRFAAKLWGNLPDESHT